MNSVFSSALTSPTPVLNSAWISEGSLGGCQIWGLMIFPGQMMLQRKQWGTKSNLSAMQHSGSPSMVLSGNPFLS